MAPGRREAAGAPVAARGGWRVGGFVVTVAVLVAMAAFVAGRIPEAPARPFSVDSARPGGLLGLRLWLEEMGYRVQAPGDDLLEGEPRVAFLFPGADLDEADRANLRDWVEQGNTLVVANAHGLGLPATFGVMIQTRQTYSDVKLWPMQPVFPSSGREHRRASGSALSTMTPAWQTVPIARTDHGDTAMLLQTLGDGTVWHTGVDGALTNADLRNGWGRDLVVAALRGAPAGSTVAIINGESRSSGVLANQGDSPDGLWQWLLVHPIGWATFAFAAVLLLYLFTQGRRLGPPLPSGLPAGRRAGVEHILAMAGLSQRAGHRDAVAAYQKARLKRRLGQATRTSADLDDAAFVAALAREAGAPPDKLEDLAGLLARFDRVNDDATLVRTVAEAYGFSLE